MSSVIQTMASLASAAMMVFSTALDAAAPQQDVDGLLFLANRQWTLHENYVPETVTAQVRGQVRNMRADAAEALKEMFDACKAEKKVTLVSVSGYRGYNKQKNIYDRKYRSVGKNAAKADAYVARPGASEHQLGLAMDVGQANNDSGLTSSFGKTKGGKWLAEHCWEYGFILRYQQGWEDVTGYSFEPWHVRYVGKENAKRIHEAEVPLETYLQMLRQSVLMEIVSFR